MNIFHQDFIIETEIAEESFRDKAILPFFVVGGFPELNENHGTFNNEIVISFQILG